MNDTPPRRAADRTTLGWREWIHLVDLGNTPILSKVDTGAKTCALHTFYIEEFERNGEPWVRFGLHPNRHNEDDPVHCEAKISDRRDVTDSGGHTENRYVIKTTLTVGEDRFRAEVTLTNRDNMRFRFLLGRNGLRKRFVVDAAKSYRLGRR